jgi:hypothetical protein
MSQFSVAVANAMLDAIETAIGVTPIMTIRTGVTPASCATANSGTVIATINLPSDWMAAASAGSKAKSGTWQDASTDAAGLGGHYRIHDSTATTCHDQGFVYQTWAISTAYLLNHQVQNGANIYRCTTAGTSAGSGGPTGTGSGITDGTAVWSYIGQANGLLIDNTNFGAGQSFTINTYSLTGPI